MEPILLIDSSYFIFYRIHALLTWWKLANPESSQENILTIPEFQEKFKLSFSKKIKELIKRLQLEKYKIIIAKDCPRKMIWRNDYFKLLHHIDSILPEELLDFPNNKDILLQKYSVESNEQYKGNRNNTLNVKPIFNLVWQEKLFELAGANIIVQHEYLEADDCIALLVKKYNQERLMTIITSDHDYLQLISKNINIYTLKYKPLISDDAKKSLFIKCICGDKSDNIKGLFKRCGKKTAERYYENPELFQTKLVENNVSQRYLLNQYLIDFNFIPLQYQNEFYNSYIL